MERSVIDNSARHPGGHHARHLKVGGYLTTLGLMTILAACSRGPEAGTPPQPEVTVPTEAASAPVNSPRICEVNEMEQILVKCKPGETLVFLPRRFGNEQFPLIATAIGCDLSHQVVQTNGGVVCTVKQLEAKPPTVAPLPKPN